MRVTASRFTEGGSIVVVGLEPALRLAVTPLPERSRAAAPGEGGGGPYPDEAGESAFPADARSRGELVAGAKVGSLVPEAEEAESKEMPPLAELVERIPVEVRAALEDLFRARFVVVKRIPKSALKI
ncbi:MAG: hypothetical protein RL077_1954 [Verrucomicrobiota bacterium]|jgi:hypothetical protein